MSQQPELDLDVFARVVNGEIVELPVYRLHIRNRAHPLSWYRPVIDVDKPELPAFSYYEVTHKVAETCVYASYKVIPYTLAQMLSQLTRQGRPGDNTPPVIGDIDPIVINHIYGLVSNYATDKLNAFAAERQYDSIKSLIEYRHFSIPQLQAEGQRGFDLLQQTWAILLAYFNGVSTGVESVPTSITQIDNLIPALTWTTQA